VPKEFYGDPMERLHQTLVIDGVTVQEARAGDMIHNIPELIEYASSLITVFPGDVLQSGTSGGTGAGRVQRASGSGFLVDGETISASIDGIGTLTHTVRAEEGVPADLSGAQLPPVSTYRNP
jgi:2-keto-4-pentenoate hydratase/2-oxohepta-3-ene-1,7-dioic acid hydratase in catechol pathway